MVSAFTCHRHEMTLWGPGPSQPRKMNQPEVGAAPLSFLSLTTEDPPHPTFCTKEAKDIFSFVTSGLLRLVAWQMFTSVSVVLAA